MEPSDAETVALPEELHEDLGWLLSQVLHGFLQATQAAVGDLPGGLRGLQVLSAAASGCSRNQLEVARRLGIDRSVMVRLVDDLERSQLVKRCPDPADRRARIIRPTDTGLGWLREMTARLRLAEQHVLAPLTADEQTVFTDALRRVVVGVLASGLPPASGPCDGTPGMAETAGA
ncbi:MarR family winged helix-turn-helix transcriptional regulator [Frankia sp. Cppng1_Ct_nod]|uniref:MarR family winged helix-turn-helix transcriptional regulator n=1 Tax=Frankia sp. Cppng1_Ct_nod TaxID=2897162 RepID=UPI001041AA2E|nr:MarR family winged helix-turn-helix transcriptional regulator [Frankia sp. Cppng1_Ct_nod]